MKVRYQFPWPYWSAGSCVVILLIAASISCGTANNHQLAESQADLKLPLNELNYYKVSEAEMGDVRHELRRFLWVEVPKTARRTREDVDRLSYVLIPPRQVSDDYEANIEQLRLYFNSADQKYIITYQINAKSQPNDSYAITGTGHCKLIPDDNGRLAWAAEISQSDKLVVSSNRAFVPIPATASNALLAATTTTTCRTLNKRLRLRASASGPA